MNTYSEFQVNIISNNRDITKCQSFCNMTTMTTTTITPRPQQYLRFSPKTVKLKMSPLVAVSKTSILKVLHGNTKSPTGCMYSCRYNFCNMTKMKTSMTPRPQQYLGFTPKTVELKMSLLVALSKTSILKVLHGNTKSPTGCMYSCRYNILLEVKEVLKL